MSDYGSIMFSCQRLEDFSDTMYAVRQKLPNDVAKQLLEIYKSYFSAYGYHSAYDRINNRTIAQIFAEFQKPDLKPIASGQVDGVRYSLYEPQQPNAPDSKSIPNE